MNLMRAHLPDHFRPRGEPRSRPCRRCAWNVLWRNVTRVISKPPDPARHAAERVATCVTSAIACSEASRPGRLRLEGCERGATVAVRAHGCQDPRESDADVVPASERRISVDATPRGPGHKTCVLARGLDLDAASTLHAVVMFISSQMRTEPVRGPAIQAG